MLFKLSAVAAATSATVLASVSADPSIAVTETALVNEQAAEASAASASFADPYVPHKMLKAAKKEEERVQSAVLRNGEDNYPKEATVENEEELLENDPAKFFGILDHRNLQLDCSSCSFPRPSVASYNDLYDALTICYGRNTSASGYVAPVPARCTNLYDDVPVNCWDVSDITNFDYAFYGLQTFNEPLNCWDMSSATNLTEMFSGASAFNQDIGDWVVSNVESIQGMFYSATNLVDPKITNWDTSSITDMSYAFTYAFKFNGALNGWDTSKVTDMREMFVYAQVFNKQMYWDVSKVENMKEMFFGAERLNQNIGDWDMSSVTDIGGMFNYAVSFNRAINTWDVSKVTNMAYTLTYAYRFNKPLRSWNTSSVEDMRGMFDSATRFDQDIDDWNVESVVNFDSMFDGAEKFNQPIGKWKPYSAKYMNYMFANAESFNQCLQNWVVDTRADVEVKDMFSNSSCTNTGTPNQLQGPWCQTISPFCLSKRENEIPVFELSDFYQAECSDIPKESTRFNIIRNNDDRVVTNDFDPTQGGDEDNYDVRRKHCNFIEQNPRKAKQDNCNSVARILNSDIPEINPRLTGSVVYIKVYSLCPEACKACPGSKCRDEKQRFNVGIKPNKRCGFLEGYSDLRKKQLCNKKQISVIKKNGQTYPKLLGEHCARTCGKVGAGKCGPFLKDYESEDE